LKSWEEEKKKSFRWLTLWVFSLLQDKADYDRLSYSKKEDQIDLLTRILTVGEADQGDEVLASDKEQNVSLSSKKLAIARRSVSSLTGLSGARGLSYMEYQTGAGASGQGQRRNPRHDPNRERHHLFRFRNKYQK